MRTVVKLGVLVWAGLIPGLLAHAQFLPEPLALVASPTSPSPGEAFVVEVSAPAMDKNASYFSWAVDRKSRSDLSVTVLSVTWLTRTLVVVPIASATVQG